MICTPVWASQEAPEPTPAPAPARGTIAEIAPLDGHDISTTWATARSSTSTAGWQRLELHSAHDINERGQTVGQGRLNGRYRGFLLTPPKK